MSNDVVVWETSTHRAVMLARGHPMPRRLKKVVSFVLPVALGGFVLAMAIANRSSPKPTMDAPAPRLVRVIDVERRAVVPRALVHGTVRPARRWSGVAQVAGRITSRHERLEVGAAISGGEELLQIDRTEYDLAVTELEASLREIDARLQEIATQERTSGERLAVERASYDTAYDELKRKRTLDRATISQTVLDQEERNVLAQQARVLELEANLARLPDQRRTLEATREVTDARLATARLRVEYTTMKAPFDARITRVNVERTQYATVGQTLVELTGVDVAEIQAEVPLGSFRSLLPLVNGNAAVFERLRKENAFQELGLQGTVRLRAGDFRVTWEAKVARMGSTLDPRTRTLPLILEVAKPYEQAIPGVRPPLVEGMFCEVEIRGPAKPDRVLVPRGAIHEEGVYLAVDGTLQRRSIERAFALGDFVVLNAGLEGGERLVLTDVVPALPGTPLETEVDETMRERLVRMARGEGDLR